MNLNPCRSKTRFSTSKPIWSTVSWLRGWKELQSLNLDVSHGLAQINVLSKQRAWQQALQLSPTVHCFQSVLRDTDIQAYTALPTCTTAPSHPSSQVESAPLPTPPPETAPPPTGPAASHSSTQLRKPITNNTASPPTAQERGSPLMHPHPHHPPATAQPGKEVLTNPGTELELRAHFPETQQKHLRSAGDLLFAD